MCCIFVKLVIYFGIGLVVSTKFKDSDKLDQLRWADFEDDRQVLCDRVVLIVKYMGDREPDSPLGKFRCLAPAVLISEDRVLTSLNPFRDAMKSSKKSKYDDDENPTVVILEKRQVVSTDKILYKLSHHSIICGREIVMTEPKKQFWVGKQKRYSPVHDLMVFRIRNELKNILKTPPTSFQVFASGEYELAGPIITNLAFPNESLGKDVTFCSLGYRNKKEIKNFTQMHSTQYEEDENAVEECDEWIPREWGHHICVQNVQRHRALGSGAMLFHNDKLYGVGGSLLYKGKKSVMLFTDVRPYYEIIMSACTYYSQKKHAAACHKV